MVCEDVLCGDRREEESGEHGGEEEEDGEMR